MTASSDTGQLESALGRLAADPSDAQAWEVLVASTWPFVVATAHRALPARQRFIDADDLAQEVYFKLAEYWHAQRPALRDRDSLFALLAVMTRRIAADVGRWQTRGKRDVRREVSGMTDAPQTDVSLAGVEMRDLLDRLCRLLEAEHRRVLKLRLQGYEVAEIAGKLQVSRRTVERRLQEIRDRLGPEVDVQ